MINGIARARTVDRGWLGSNPTTHDFGCADEIGNNPLERVSVPGGGRKAYRSALIAAQQIWLFNIRDGSFSTDQRCLRDVRFPPNRDQIAASRQ
jgi:hypothetical protein